MTARTQQLAAPALRVAIALGALYFVWGSTYLGIRIVVQTIPPLLSSGVRFLIAGAILYLAVGRVSGSPTGTAGLAGTRSRAGTGSRRLALYRPTRLQWRDAAIIGTFLLAGGNGTVTIAEVTVPSGIAALIIATMPMWVAVIGRAAFGIRIGALTVTGIALGLVGVGILVWPSGDVGRLDPFGTAMVICSPILWSIGSLYSRHAAHPANPLVGVAMQMLAGGAVLLVLAVVLGEVGGFNPAQVSTESLLAVGYLIAVGSLIGYSAYGWLLRVAPLSLISTYAYVNPIVAVILGSLILSEPITPRTLLAGGVIVAAVAVIVWARGREGAASPAQRPVPEELIEAN